MVSLNFLEEISSLSHSNHLEVISFANILSHSEGFLLIFFMVSFAVQNLLSLIAAAAAAKLLLSCPTLYDPMDGNPPGSPFPGILQAKTLDRVAISFSNA